MCVYGGGVVPQGGVGDRHLVTIPQGVVGDRLPWGGERHGGVRVHTHTHAHAHPGLHRGPHRWGATQPEDASVAVQAQPGDLVNMVKPPAPPPPPPHTHIRCAGLPARQPDSERMVSQMEVGIRPVEPRSLQFVDDLYELGVTHTHN